MLRIVLTPSDLASVRFEADPGPLVDAGLVGHSRKQRVPVYAGAAWFLAGLGKERA